MTSIQINVLPPNLAIVDVGEQSQEHTIAKCRNLKAVLHDRDYSERVKGPNDLKLSDAPCVAQPVRAKRKQRM